MALSQVQLPNSEQKPSTLERALKIMDMAKMGLDIYGGFSKFGVKKPPTSVPKPAVGSVYDNTGIYVGERT